MKDKINTNKLEKNESKKELNDSKAICQKKRQKNET